jgi:hypothetical protein
MEPPPPTRPNENPTNDPAATERIYCRAVKSIGGASIIVKSIVLPYPLATTLAGPPD